MDVFTRGGLKRPSRPLYCHPHGGPFEHLTRRLTASSTARVNTSIVDEIQQRQPRHFAPERVEAGQRDDIRCHRR